MEPKTTAIRGAFLIVAKDVIVAQDLAATITDNRPGAQVLLARSLETGAEALAGVAMIDTAFVAAEPEAFEGSRLAGCLVARGAQVVLMGVLSTRPARSARWTMLPFPFRTEDVRRLILAP